MACAEAFRSRLGRRAPLTLLPVVVLLGSLACDDGMSGVDASDSDAGGSGSGGGATEPLTRCEHLAEIPLGDGLFLQNNMWGQDGATNAEQCVTRTGSPWPVSWTWTWPEDNEQVRGYPFLGFGQDPWRPASTLPQLPRQVSELGVLTIKHQLRTEATGQYNLAFDIWITHEPGVTTPPEANLSRELMIWLDKTEVPLPPSWLVGEVEVDGAVYDFYRGVDEPTGSYVRDYLAFVAREPRLSGTTKIDAFVLYLAENDYVTADEYVRNVFLGNEIWFGSGTTTVEAYSVAFE